MKIVILFILSTISLCGTSFADQGKILIILSEQNQLPLKNGKKFATGFYLNELMLPVLALKNSNYNFVFVTPNGGVPSLDISSDAPKYFGSEEEYQEAKQYLNELRLTDKFKSPVLSFRDVQKNLQNFKGIFIPGGHAPMIDLAFSKELGAILTHFHNNNKPTALICHAPVALISTLINPHLATIGPTIESWIYDGYRMTVYTNEEEKYTEANKIKGELLFYPATALKNAGANLQQSRMWSSNAVRDRELITGQNPSSDRKFIDLFLSALSE